MQTQYWAMRKRQKTGPHESRESALIAFRAQFPFKGEPYEARAAHNQIMTGYGTFGPSFDIRWHDAKEIGTHAQD